MPLKRAVPAEPAPPTSAEIKAAVEHAHETFASPRYQPPQLPQVAIEFLALSHQVEVPMSKIADLLQRDPVLAGRVLQRVRSPLYASRMPVQTLPAAIVRLGIDTLRSLVLEVALTVGIFRSTTYAAPMERLRVHAVATAHLARRIAKATDVDPETAFLAGLLHDVGIAAALIELSRQKAFAAGTQLIWATLDHLHEPVGVRLLELWGLSKELQSAVGQHHQFSSGRTAKPLLAVLRMAEEAANGLGLGVFPVGQPGLRQTFEDAKPAASAQARRTLALTDAALAKIGADAAKELPGADAELGRMLSVTVALRKAAKKQPQIR